MSAHWFFSLLIGVAWGFANLWCLAKAVSCAIEGKSGRRLTGWLVLKFLGLYGLLAWLLVGLHLSAGGWLVGFKIWLAGFAVARFSSVRGFMAGSKRSFLGLLAPAFLLFWGIFDVGLACASQAVDGTGGPAHPPEIPNLITLLTQGSHGPVVEFLHTWENGIFAFVIVGLVGGLIALGARTLAMIPSRGQIAVEAIIEGLENLVCGMLGKEEGRRYLPFIGTLFIFILSMNLAGLVPGLKSPTSRFEMTFALAFCVFCFVQWTGIRRLGVGGYLDHLLGQPRDLVGWILSPLMLFIHGIGEIVKPVSLSLRLFGNIMGEDTLLGVFVTLGALSMAWSHLPIGLPLHLPFVFLALIFSVVQALVFTSLSTIYIYMMLPHEPHQEAVGSPGQAH